MRSIVLSIVLVFACALAGAQDLVVTNARIIDGTGALIDRGSVVISGGRITSVTEGGTSAPGERMDASGMTVMPGLIDSHVHVGRTGAPDAAALRACLDAGFTTLRDLGVSVAFVSTVIREFGGLSAEHLAPEVVWAGPMITAPGGYPLKEPRFARAGQAVESAEEAIGLIDSLKEAGVAIIKLGLERGRYIDEGWARLDVELIRAITEHAHGHGMRVTAHATHPDDVRLALDGGVDGLAHASLQPLPDELIAEMVARDVVVVTTATTWARSEVWDIAAQNARRYAEAGGLVAIGIDGPGCFGDTAGIEPYLAELQFLRAAGMSNQQLLQSATRNGAIVANLAEETGTIEAGKRADMIIVDGDPLADLRTLRNVVTVIKAGTVTEPLRPPRMTPQPGSEAAVRHLIEDFARGEPNYDLLPPGLAQQAREGQLPALQAMFGQLGAIETITFLYVDRRGADVYDVQLANASLVIWLMLDDAGRMTILDLQL